MEEKRENLPREREGNMGNVAMNAQRKELLVEWIGDNPLGVTAQELANHFEVHYQTAWGWLKTLSDLKLIVRSGGKQPWRFYAKAQEGGSNPIRIKEGRESKEIAQWALESLQHTGLAELSHAFVYLFVRSYYYDAPDHQHLRGVMTPNEVRDQIERTLKTCRDFLGVVEQLLSLRSPWTEGPTFATRFGSAPVGVGMQEAVEAAATYSKVIGSKNLTGGGDIEIMEDQEADEGEVGAI